MDGISKEAVVARVNPAIVETGRDEFSINKIPR